MISLGKPPVHAATSELPVALERLVILERLDDRLRTTYATAMHTRHQCSGRVEIHVSSEMPDLLREWAYAPGDALAATIWGFPIVVDERLPADTIQIHSVQSVH